MKRLFALCLFLAACGGPSENPSDVAGDEALTSDSSLQIGCTLEYATWAPSFIGGGGSGTVAGITLSGFFAKDGFRMTMADDSRTGSKPFAMVVAPLPGNAHLMQVWLFNPDGSNQSYGQIPLPSVTVGRVLFDVNARISPVQALDDRIQRRTFDFIHARCEVQRVGG